MRRLAFLLGLVAACSADSATPPGPTEPCPRTDLDELPASTAHTPRWALEPWISKDISTRDDTYAFVGGFQDRDIPVGVVVIDSPWETHYNTFVPNPTRYADFGGMISDMHARGVRVVAWVTGMTNTSGLDSEPGGDTYVGASPNYAEGDRCGYFIDQSATYFWWKGFGSGIDFFHPSATAWWHRQQDPVLAMGLDGWKLDFAESYIKTDPVQTFAGPESHQAYSEAYYHDYLAYGRKVRGDDFLTMTRAWDESYGFAGRFYARKEDAPVAWMGDNRRDWVGLGDALDEMLTSAAAGYAMVGSDIGGYLDHDDKDLAGPEIPFDLENFERWIAVGALSPLMELHGRANLTPWTTPDKPDEVTAIYRYWAKLHHELVPFFYSLVEEGWGHGTSAVVPVGDAGSWHGDDRYLLGQALLVAPLLAAGGKRDVPLPSGASYYDFWDPTAAPYAGGTTLAAYDATDPQRVPLFFREGAIVPMNVEDDVTGFGDAASKGALTVVVYPGSASSFVLHDEDGAPTHIDASAAGGAATLHIDRALRTTIFRVRVETAPAGATLDGAAMTVFATRGEFDAAASGLYVDAPDHFAWVKVPPGGPDTITVP